jgi:hypothetical protein
MSLVSVLARLYFGNYVNEGIGLKYKLFVPPVVPPKEKLSASIYINY